MCMRFAFTPMDVYDVLSRYELDSSDHEIKPRYNIAPNQNVPVVCNDSPKILTQAVWGIPTHWKPEPGMEKALYNARAETIDTKPSFKKHFVENRCLMLASWFYEWRKKDTQPFKISLKGGKLFAFAGIYASNKEGGRTVCMITTSTNELVSQVHNRMPVILPQISEKAWLSMTPEEAKALLKPFPAESMEMSEIAKSINSSRKEGPDVVKPKEEKGSLLDYMG